MLSFRLLPLMIVAALAAPFAQADSATLIPSRDNTIYKDPFGALSNGAGNTLYVGRNSTGEIRRGVLIFDIVGTIPAGSTITAARLRLRRTIDLASGSETLRAHKLLADWGEGTSNDTSGTGAGAASATGDVTWLHRFYDTDDWTTDGGDFESTASATSFLGAIVDFDSAQMAADVQEWLDNGGNFGWLLKAQESGNDSMNGYGSRENGTNANRPTLDVEFTPPGLDFGDARDEYGTTLANDGARHTIIPGIKLGNNIDAEPDGQPNNFANGDDISGINDEDGVIIGSVVPGQSVNISVTRTGSGFLYAWIDFNKDGSFLGAGEQVIDQLSLTSGTSTIPIVIPVTAARGSTVSRFRYSTDTGLGPTGAASDGEVEDYSVFVESLDWGDAPESYGTTWASNGPRHRIIDGLGSVFLGTNGSSDIDGQPSAGANADTKDDGITIASSLQAGTTVSIIVDAFRAGKLDAWLDFDGNGVFGTGEKIFDSVNVVGGDNELSFNLPGTAAIGTTYARFRISSGGGLAPTGYAPDGEVEDYAVEIFGYDFGDTGLGYPTTLEEDGARHKVGGTLFLGPSVDLEADAAVSGNRAMGDDINNTDDENGVSVVETALLAFYSGESQTIRVNASEDGGFLNAWIDFNRNTNWDDPGEQIATDLPLSAGDNTIEIQTPATTTEVSLYGRFRVSTQGGLSPTGEAPNGEVEDHEFRLIPFDYGDAGGRYPTLREDDGARHSQELAVVSLGSTIDMEPDGQPSANADGDDILGTDDEDGITFSTTTLGPNSELTITATRDGDPLPFVYLNGWMDFDGDGTWSESEHIIEEATFNTSFVRTIDVSDYILGAPSGAARFRITGLPNEGNSPTGLARTGEVEDYLLTFEPDPIDYGDAPASYGTLVADNGARHLIALTGPFFGASVGGDADGQPSAVADTDDDNGVTIPASLVVGVESAIQINASSSGMLDAWIDFDGDGEFSGTERIADSLPVLGGPAVLAVMPPGDAIVGDTYARFRISSAGGLEPNGFALDGEVEDYKVAIAIPAEGEGSAEGTVDGEGTTEGTAEGLAEGSPEGITEGLIEGSVEGVADGEGALEGSTEGSADGEGSTEGTVDGEGATEGAAEGSPEGTAEGSVEGSAEGAADGEGTLEGSTDGAAEGEGETLSTYEQLLYVFATADISVDSRLSLAEILAQGYVFTQEQLDSADANADGLLSVSELLAIVGGGILISADTNGDFAIALGELLRVVQLFNTGQYFCAENPGASEDGYGLLPLEGAEPTCLLHSVDGNSDKVISLSELLRTIQFYNLGGYIYCPDLSPEDSFCASS